MVRKSLPMQGASTYLVEPEVAQTGKAASSCMLGNDLKGTTMAWTTPTLVEICIGLEINGYLPAEL
jgi:coenzyme PQQ precursor peptide PqqA